ncbi:hypothetical protein I551_0805 [Mycobacterium ulcerans str. Harvey]|uniref:Uncharacterized protein n=1 Tax=Mycobacterium ulcerans str. Harvey TaxID=1299332 RepID=A0ABN0R675_MYCUL|nr:hypothetical protein I551_0805 [Mycobacterium ulcerans str. Harvey]
MMWNSAASMNRPASVTVVKSTVCSTGLSRSVDHASGG